MKIAPPKGEVIFMAGALGFEPRLKVLDPALREELGGDP